MKITIHTAAKSFEYEGDEVYVSSSISGFVDVRRRENPSEQFYVEGYLWWKKKKTYTSHDHVILGQHKKSLITEIEYERDAS